MPLEDTRGRSSSLLHTAPCWFDSTLFSSPHFLLWSFDEQKVFVVLCHTRQEVNLSNSSSRCSTAPSRVSVNRHYHAGREMNLFIILFYFVDMNIKMKANLQKISSLSLLAGDSDTLR